ncbi:MAG: HAD hydrolase-like protein [Candidatus Woesearchaeota archaeon]|jgi:putative hydrolase of the HAD superfamily|nr:HAD hydrolase-like protein [Candidatus Woesearchaeota archaeon]MDP7324231.1 HAD hydrolase-like protein [Candidatus Woesearchaeota archaeon]MDP7457564.1 HAD hydrolase-like protein [Candidatus Woesearchaeota archaeon]
MKIYFDLDGVLTLNKSGGGQICENLAKLSGLGLDKVTEGYNIYSSDLYLGKVMFKDVWDDLGKSLGVDLDYGKLDEVLGNTPLNNEVMAIALSLKEKGHELGIITDNPLERAHFLIKEFGLKGIFDPIIISSEVHCMKTEAEMFSSVPKGSIFIDNTERNLAIPESLGIKTIFFENVEGLKMKLKEYQVDV